MTYNIRFVIENLRNRDLVMFDMVSNNLSCVLTHILDRPNRFQLLIIWCSYLHDGMLPIDKLSNRESIWLGLLS